jgi:integrase
LLLTDIIIKALLKERGFTYKALAETADVSEATVSAGCKGKNIAKQSAEKICAVLGLKFEAVFKPVGKEILSASTVNHYYRFLSSVLSEAVKLEMIPSNPCQRARPPKLPRKTPQIFDDKQCLEILECLETQPLKYQAAIKTLLHTGIRRGELCGLEWADIDFDRNMIHIRRESPYLPGKGVYAEDGKTDSAIRSITVSSPAIEALKQYKLQRIKEAFALGQSINQRGMVFVTANGNPIYPDTFTSWWSAFLKRHDFPHCSLHKLRHTNASLLIAGGLPVTTVSERLGHANAAITTQIYAHAIKSADGRAVAHLDNMLNPKSFKG